MTGRLYKVLIVIIMVLLITSCKKAINWNVTMNPHGKEPYGTYLFYNALKEYYPNTPVHLLKSNYNFAVKGAQSMPYDELMILLGKNALFSEEEVAQLFNYVYNGNDVLLSAVHIDTLFMESLFVTLSNENNQGDNELKIVDGEKVSVYKGEEVSSLSSAIKIDTTLDAGVKGYYNNYPNLVAYQYGYGHIYLHTNPIAFTNKSMLGDNKKYVEQILGFLNHDKYSKVVFSSFLTHNNSSTDFDILMDYPAFRWAFYLLIILLFVFILFEFKRRQKVVPEIVNNNNNTKAFIETVGYLYFNEGDLKNLAEKKVKYFLEYVRSTYYIDTRTIDNEFAEKLLLKSQVDKAAVDALVLLITKVNSGITLTKNEIFTLDSTIKRFKYGQHK